METKQKIWPKQAPENIIVRMPNWLGDLVMAAPLLHDLRKKYLRSTITAMCQSNVAGLLKCDPNINDIYSYKKPSGWIRRSEPTEIIESLRKGQYDMGVLTTNSFSSAWWFWRGHVANRVGFDRNCRGLLLNKAVEEPQNIKTQHLVLTYKELLTPMGIPISTTAPRLFVSPTEEIAAKNLLHNYGIDLQKQIVIGINPGAAYGSAKCWLPDRFRSVTEQLLQDPRVIVLYFGDQAGSSLVHEICQGLGPRVINMAGKTSLRELMALIQICNVLLTNDSGPMHIASALSTPLVALFGSTNEVRTGPYGGGIVIHKHVECSPCYYRTCPIDFRCMKKIESDEVYQAILKQLALRK
jgi:heptosyltransferase-2